MATFRSRSSQSIVGRSMSTLRSDHLKGVVQLLVFEGVQIVVTVPSLRHGLSKVKPAREQRKRRARVAEMKLIHSGKIFSIFIILVQFISSIRNNWGLIIFSFTCIRIWGKSAHFIDELAANDTTARETQRVEAKRSRHHCQGKASGHSGRWQPHERSRSLRHNRHNCVNSRLRKLCILSLLINFWCKPVPCRLLLIMVCRTTVVSLYILVASDAFFAHILAHHVCVLTVPSPQRHEVMVPCQPPQPSDGTLPTTAA